MKQENLKKIEIKMENKNSKEVIVCFIRPDKMKKLLEDNEFLRNMAEQFEEL